MQNIILNIILIPNNTLSIIVLFLFMHWNIRLTGHIRADIKIRQMNIKKSSSPKKFSIITKSENRLITSIIGKLAQLNFFCGGSCFIISSVIIITSGNILKY